VFSQNSAYAAFAGAHESDQNNGLPPRQTTSRIRPVTRHISPLQFGWPPDAARFADSVFLIYSRRVF
jgi:hypothetical protein